MSYMKALLLCKCIFREEVVCGQLFFDTIVFTPEALRHLIAAHGHYVDECPSANSARASWLLTPRAIDATGADYVALGHWNVATDVSTERVAAHYSGSPDYAQTINVVTFRDEEPAVIEAVTVKGLPS